MKKKSFSIFAFIIIALFVISPVVFWAFLPKNKEKESVKGASVSQNFNGTSVTLNSVEGTWDLYKYLCADVNTCFESLISGKKLSTVSGGPVENHELLIEYTPGWEEYKYLKVYVKAGWGTTGTSFNITNKGNIEGTITNLVNYKGSDYEVVLIPISKIDKSFVRGPAFSNF